MPSRPSLDLSMATPGRLRALGGGILALLVIGLGSTAVFQVEPEEEGVVLRFGRFDRIVQPGLHFKLPSPAETVRKVPTQRQLKEEFGFRTTSADVRTTYSDQNLDDEKLMLTGDLNVAQVEWISQYRIGEPFWAGWEHIPTRPISV